MREGKPSLTAVWVAACRALGTLLPDEVRIADDPYGARFCWPGMELLLAAGKKVPALARAVLAPVRPWVAYMQVRTRAIDEVLLEFVAGGGRQVVILGAGFDCRAARFADRLGGVRLFEVDHGSTQSLKRAAMAEERQAPVRYVEWDLEARSMAELPGALAERGLEEGEPTLVIWEGVTMYLSERAVDETLAAVRRLGAPGSRIVFTYLERRRVERPEGALRRAADLARRIGEPFRFGFEPTELRGWLAARGFALERDRSEAELAEALLPPAWRRHVGPLGDHVAVARSLPS